jgi:hypothetical protein
MVLSNDTIQAAAEKRETMPLEPDAVRLQRLFRAVIR